jgi:hypothetical protein
MRYLQSTISLVKYHRPHVIVLTGLCDAIFETMMREFKKDGYSYEKIGGANVQGALQGEMFIFTMDDWCQRMHKYFKKFSRSRINGTGFMHYNINLVGGGNYDIVCASFDNNVTTRKQQLTELETYIGGMEKCIVCADAKISKWNEPPLFVAENMIDMWREYGRSTNEFNFKNERYDRVWISNTPHITGKSFSLLDSSSERLPIMIEVD